jgi:hypothetical protein
MKGLIPTLGIFVLFAASAQDAAAQYGRGRGNDRGRADRVCFYQDVQYRGWEECYYPGDEVSNLNRRGNNVSSIRVFGRSGVTVYDNSNFRGNSTEFTADVRDLGLRSYGAPRSWNDRIESFRISSDYGRGGWARGRQRQQDRWENRQESQDRWEDQTDSQNGVCVYENANYQGRSECWYGGAYQDDLARLGGWSDRISSIRILGNGAAVFYRDIGFQGERLIVNNDIPSLANMPMSGFGSWNDQISSARIEDRGGRYRLGR